MANYQNKKTEGWYYRQHKESYIRNSRKLIKYHNISYSVQKMVLRNVTVQAHFRIISAVTISNTICGIQWNI